MSEAVLKTNPMKKISIEKVVVNIGCGNEFPVKDARTIIESVTNDKSVTVKTTKRGSFNVGIGKEIGVKTTIRKNIDTFLKRMFEGKEGVIKESNFDNNGNLAFGIKEYIDIPDMDYDPNLKMSGFDVCITMQRPGYAIKKKKIAHRVGTNHRITKEESVEFIKNKFGIIVE